MTEETNADLSLTGRMELIACSMERVGFSGSVDVIREGITAIKEISNESVTNAAECVRLMQQDEVLRSELTAMADKVQEVAERNKALEEDMKIKNEAHVRDLLDAEFIKADHDKYQEALRKIASGEGVYGQQAHEYKQIAREALQGEAKL